MNKTILMGNLGQDPELRYTGSGTPVLNLRIATSERVKRDGQWTDHAEWHSVVVWSKRAESLSKILRKGSRVLIEGKLRTTSYDGRDGAKRYKTEIVADVVELCDRRGGSGAPDDAGGHFRTPEPDPATYDAAPDFSPGDDDDIPF